VIHTVPWFSLYGDNQKVENRTKMTTNCPTFIPILLALAAFGYFYNRWVERLENGGHDRGYMGLIVAAGCTITLAGAALLIGLEPITWVFCCFIASGLPMVLGSIARHCRARSKAQRDCLDHNERKINDGTH
jgi:hypothetical protein